MHSIRFERSKKKERSHVRIHNESGTSSFRGCIFFCFTERFKQLSLITQCLYSHTRTHLLLCTVLRSQHKTDTACPCICVYICICVCRSISVHHTHEVWTSGVRTYTFTITNTPSNSCKSLHFRRKRDRWWESEKENSVYNLQMYGVQCLHRAILSPRALKGSTNTPNIIYSKRLFFFWLAMDFTYIA